MVRAEKFLFCFRGGSRKSDYMAWREKCSLHFPFTLTNPYDQTYKEQAQIYLWHAPEKSQKLLKLKRLATCNNGNKKFVQNRFPISVSSLSLSAFQEFLFIVFLPVVLKVALSLSPSSIWILNPNLYPQEWVWNDYCSVIESLTYWDFEKVTWC